MQAGSTNLDPDDPIRPHGRPKETLPTEEPAEEERHRTSESAGTMSVELPVGRLEIDPALSMAEAFRRAFAGGCAVATRQAQGADSDPAIAVLEFRKSMRRLRGLLRLAQPGLSEATFRHLNAELRRAARLASSLRDTRILLRILDSLPEDAETETARASVRTIFSAENAQLDRTAREAELLAKCQGTLTDLSAFFFIALKGVELSPGPVSEALDSSVLRPRERLSKVFRSWKKKDIHDLRKDLKVLRYQLEFLLPLAPEPLGKRRKRVRDFARALGRVTDLIVLEEALRNVRAQGQESDGRSPPQPDVRSLLRATRQHRRAVLEETLLRHGRALLGKPPKVRVLLEALPQSTVPWPEPASKQEANDVDRPPTAEAPSPAVKQNSGSPDTSPASTPSGGPLS